MESSSVGMWIFWGMLALAAVPLWVAIQRGTELFVVQITGGRCHLLRGRLPPALWSELVDVIERGKVSQGKVVCFLSGGSPAVRYQGRNAEVVTQQLRNVVGRFPLIRIRTGTFRA